MFEGAAARILFRWARRIKERCVADVAVISDYFAIITLVLAIMATEAARRS